MSAPTTIDASQAQKFPIAKNTKTPPCGARDVMPEAMLIAPVTAAPTIDAGMTRSGSAAANGIAPSEMNDSPSRYAALPFSRSGFVKP